MDSEHRHELKENDLKEFFTHFGQWWSRHGNTTLITITLVLLVVFGVRLYRTSVTSAHDNAWFDWANANSPASLKQVAADHADPAVQALAYLAAGDMLLKEARRAASVTSVAEPANSGIPGASDAGSSAADALAEAQALYTTVLNESKHAVFRANALLGLAQVAEDRHDWAAAAQHYEAIQQLATDYPALEQTAKARLALLPQLEQPVKFAPEPVYDPNQQSFDVTGDLSLPGFDMPSFSMPDTTFGGGTVVEEVVTEQPAMPADPESPATD